MKEKFEATANLNKDLYEMNDISKINDLLRKARILMYGLDEESCNVLRESLSMTAQRKLARLCADYLVDSTTIHLSPAFQEKLVTYLALSEDHSADPETADDDDQDGVEISVEGNAGVETDIAALVEMYQHTKAAATSCREGDLFDCLGRLQRALAIPATRSAAACCLRHLEDSLCEQILAKSRKFGLDQNEVIDPWDALDIALKSEDCCKHPKEYFRYFYYDVEQMGFGFYENIFDEVTHPF